MKTLKLIREDYKIEINLPQRFEEITKEYLEDCTAHVSPAPNYVLVAVVYKEALSIILTANKKNKPINTAIIPVFVKAGTSNDEFINSLELGSRVIIAGSDLSIGHHISCPNNEITPNKIVNLCNDNKDIYMDALADITKNYFVEFKLVPASAIHGKLSDSNTVLRNPLIHYENTAAENTECETKE